MKRVLKAGIIIGCLAIALFGFIGSAKAGYIEVCTGSVIVTGNQPTFYWSTSGDPQTAYQIYIYNSGWVLIYDSGVQSDGAKSAAGPVLAPGTYNWAIRVYHSTALAAWTGWANGDSFLINSAPSTPIQIAPPNNTWINYNPTYQATVSDPDGGNVRAYFEFASGVTSGWSGWVSSGSTASYAPTTPDGTYQWRVYAQDPLGLNSPSTGYWTVKKDTGAPSVSLDQPNGVITATSFNVTLSESDALSGINQGDVDVRVNSGSWQDYTSTINDFTYTGTSGNTYEFRYRAMDNAGNWSGFAYDGSVYINRSPSVTPGSVVQPDYCVCGPMATFSWTFSDPDPGDTQSAYQAQIDNNADFSSPEVNTGKIASASNSYSTTAGALAYNNTYYWRVMVWDNHDTASSWVSGPSFATPKHAYPTANFSWAPIYPSANETVQFADQSTVFGGATKSAWLWTIPDATYIDGTNSSSQNPKVKFQSQGAKQVTLKVTDSDGYACSLTKTVGVRLPLPGWKEIAP